MIRAAAEPKLQAVTLLKPVSQREGMASFWRSWSKPLFIAAGFSVWLLSLVAGRAMAPGTCRTFRK